MRCCCGVTAVLHGAGAALQLASAAAATRPASEPSAALIGRGASNPRYCVELGWLDDRVGALRDDRHVPCIVQEGAFEFGPRGTQGVDGAS
jgi:hypothetical protein